MQNADDVRRAATELLLNMWHVGRVWSPSPGRARRVFFVVDPRFSLLCWGLMAIGRTGSTSVLSGLVPAAGRPGMDMILSLL